MASASVLQRLTQRAKQAEDIINQLKQQIETVKRTAAVSVSKPEEMRLKKENEELRAQIEQLKTQLILAEIKNGVKQVPLPVKKPKLEGGVAMETQKPAENRASESVAKNSDGGAPPQPQKGGEKAKNAEKKDGGEPKTKKPKGGGDKKAGDATPEKVDISRLDMRVGKIVGVKKHPDADTLYVEDVDLGEGKTRTIVSGLVKHVPIEEMQDRLAIFMCNLKPAKMRGILSEGMIMCASSPEKVEILLTPPGSHIGDRVFAKDYSGEPDALLNPKKKIWETIKPDLRTDRNKVAAYKGAPLYIEGKGEIVAPTCVDTQIS